MSAFSQNLRISVVFFLLFFLISHLLLPIFGRSDWLFLSEWRLFALEPKLYVYDISLTKLNDELENKIGTSSENFYFRHKTNQLLINKEGREKGHFSFMNLMPETEREEFDYALFRSDLESMSFFFNEQFFMNCKCTSVKVFRIETSAAHWADLSRPIANYKIHKLAVFEKHSVENRK